MPPYDRSAALTSAAQVLKAPGTQGPGAKLVKPKPAPRRPMRQAPYAGQTTLKPRQPAGVTSVNGGGSRTFEAGPRDGYQPSGGLRGFSPGSPKAPDPSMPPGDGGSLTPLGPDTMMPGGGDSMGMDKPAWQQLQEKGIGGQGSAAANKAKLAEALGGGMDSLPAPPSVGGQVANAAQEYQMTAAKPLLRGFGGAGGESPPFIPQIDGDGNPGGGLGFDKPMGDLGAAGPDIWSRIAGARKQTPLIPQRF